MPAATTNQAYEIELDADWFEDFPVWLGNVTTPDDLTGCEAVLFLEPAPGASNQTALELATTDTDPLIAIVDNYIEVRVGKDDVNTLSAQGYRLSLRLDHASGYKEPLLVMTANVVAFGERRR